MTDRQPSLDDMIAAVRQPGWYWVRWECAPDEWDIIKYRAGSERTHPEPHWSIRGIVIIEDYDFAEIGPRIPDVATLQQHERAMKVVEAARHWKLSGDRLTAAKGDRLPFNKAFSEAGIQLRKEVAALDAAETETK